MTTYTAGAVIEVGYPFVREPFNDGESSVMSWRPGTRDEQVAPDDVDRVADGIGTMILTIVSVHKPGRWPERIFFTRRWRDPSGREFGRTGKLLCRGKASFTTMTRGYRHRFQESGNRVADQDQRRALDKAMLGSFPKPPLGPNESAF